MDRFAADAATLRERAAQLAGQPVPPHGPSAEVSARMAEACDDVLALLATASGDDVLVALDTLNALRPTLDARAQHASDPFIRSVYAGASARIADIVQQESDPE
jgi:hypothetical protein